MPLYSQTDAVNTAASPVAKPWTWPKQQTRYLAMYKLYSNRGKILRNAWKVHNTPRSINSVQDITCVQPRGKTKQNRNQTGIVNGFQCTNT